MNDKRRKKPIRPSTAPTVSLGSVAKAALLWGGGFSLIRDVLQFGAMLVMVRLLSPDIYGSFALAQSITGLLAVVSFNTFYLHAFQIRDPQAVDWQAHFVAAVVINMSLFGLTLLIAFGMALTQRYQAAAAPLAGLSVTFVIEIAATLRHGMLETRHEWQRFRLLLSLGTALGLGCGLALAWAGGGVWALVVQPLLFGLPAAVDLFWGARWRPEWSWSWARYRDTAAFAVNRIGALALQRGRLTVEQSVLTGAYDFAALGIFTRAIGLANLLAGRIGTLTVGTLYPVITRAEPHSLRMQRMAGLLILGVCWTSIPAAGWMALCADDVVALLYGPKWLPVTELLPLAVAGVAFAGLTTALSRLLLANNLARTCLVLDAGAALAALGLALWLVPISMTRYLLALVAHGGLFSVLTLGALVRARGLTLKAFNAAWGPATWAMGIAILGVLGSQAYYSAFYELPVRLSLDTLIFSSLYLVLLRLSAPSPMRNLLDVAPGGVRIQQLLRLRTA